MKLIHTAGRPIHIDDIISFKPPKGMLKNITCTCGEIIPSDDIECSNGSNELEEDFYELELECIHCKETFEFTGFGECFKEDTVTIQDHIADWSETDQKEREKKKRILRKSMFFKGSSRLMDYSIKKGSVLDNVIDEEGYVPFKSILVTGKPGHGKSYSIEDAKKLGIPFTKQLNPKRKVQNYFHYFVLVAVIILFLSNAILYKTIFFTLGLIFLFLQWISFNKAAKKISWLRTLQTKINNWEF